MLSTLKNGGGRVAERLEHALLFQGTQVRIPEEPVAECAQVLSVTPASEHPASPSGLGTYLHSHAYAYTQAHTQTYT